MLENKLIPLTSSLPHQGPRKLGKGASGPEVRALQRSLVTWMPAWKGRLAVDGEYGPQTAAALEVFKRVYGLGKDGNSLDPRTRRALATYRSRPRPLARPKLYEKARKHGFPFDREERIRETARLHPHDMVELGGHRMQAELAIRVLNFEHKVKTLDPHDEVILTCTTEGTHGSPAHAEGRAVDMVILHDGRDISDEESWKYADLAESCGLHVFNEYAYDSRYKTGPHLHAES